LIPQLDQWKKDGKKIVFTNGVFDILHVGHVTYLQQAKSLGDVLIVGLNDDDSVRKLNKGPERPINDEQSRKKVLEALRAVDGVVIFKEETPLELIQHIQPDVLVKGGDYDPDQTDSAHKQYMVGSKEVRSWGGSVQVIDFVPGFSTTSVVNKLKA
jgi:D-beta-D-heptose 7-phosphate kinase/D-beta-D-heptose 1-phosphate adenosyltransferase